MSSTSMDMETIRLRARVSFLRGMGAAIARFIGVQIATVRQAQKKRATLYQLRDLEDWQLADIGLDRAEVDAELERHGMHRGPTSLSQFQQRGY